MGKVKEGKETDYELKKDGCLYYKGRICVPGDEELKKNILKEAHSSFHVLHPGSTKMYHVLKAQCNTPMFGSVFYCSSDQCCPDN